MSKEAEESVLGGLMMFNDKLDFINLEPNHFSTLEHKQIYQAILDVNEQGLDFDAVTVFDHMESKGHQVELTYLVALSNNTPSSANIESYAAIVKRDYLNRELAKTGHLIQDIAQQGGSFDNNLESALGLMDRLKIDDESDIESNETLISRYMEKLEKLMELKGLDGLSTGIERLDEKVQGLKNGELIIVAGRPGSGKSTLALNIALENAKELPVMVFSMEMPKMQLVQRAVSCLGGVDLDWLKGGLRYDDSQWGIATKGMFSYQESKLIIDDKSVHTVQSMKIAAKKQGKLSLIVVDYLQLMNGRGNNRNDEITEISRGLKQLAKEMDCPVIALSQLNRGVEQRPNKRPKMSDLRESGAIEQDADLILFIYRDEYYYKDHAPNRGFAEIEIAKFRDGETGIAYVASDLRKSRFKDYTAFTYQPYGGEK